MPVVGSCSTTNARGLSIKTSSVTPPNLVNVLSSRKKALDGQEAWLWERFRRHRGNADVIRQELAAEKGTIVSLRTVERAV